MYNNFITIGVTIDEIIISRITGVKLDPNSPWLQRRQRDGKGNERSFQDILKNRESRLEANAPETEAATWEGNGATQSLFYEKGVNLDFFYHQRIGM